MTKITFYKKNDKFLGFEISGHTGKDDYGKDLLCCQISTISQFALMSIIEVAHLPAFQEISDGYLKLMLSERDAAVEKIQFMLESTFQGLKSIVNENKRFAKMEVKNV